MLLSKWHCPVRREILTDQKVVLWKAEVSSHTPHVFFKVRYSYSVWNATSSQVLLFSTVKSDSGSVVFNVGVATLSGLQGNCSGVTNIYLFFFMIIIIITNKELRVQIIVWDNIQTFLRKIIRKILFSLVNVFIGFALMVNTYVVLTRVIRFNLPDALASIEAN